MNLSVIIPVLNDPLEVVETVRSVRESSPSSVEILVIDDSSTYPAAIPKELGVIEHRNKTRLGVGKSRHLGATKASGDVLLFLDSHMRAAPGWYEALGKNVKPNCLHNGKCLGLWEGKMDLSKAQGEYTGARLSIYDPNEKSEWHKVLEGKWKKHANDAEVSCPMGAVYIIPRDLFFHVRGLESLEQWGSDEPFLSLKLWLSGNEIRQLNSVVFGHKFRDIPSAPYTSQYYNMIYNKLLVAYTTLEPKMFQFIQSKFKRDNNLLKALHVMGARRQSLDAERKYYQSIFQHDLEWFCRKFPDVTHPKL